MAYKRRVIRERVLQALYAYELSKEPLPDVIDYVFGDLSSQKEALEFARCFLERVVEHQDEIDKIIRNKVTNWEFSRIAVIDKLVLRMGICELMFFEDIPPKVTINEAIEIAKRYSTENSGMFVNGVLDSILIELKSSGQLKKSGRGLVEVSSKKKRKTP
ncbi:MAG: transcription antitermination factor NusB [Bacteroidota bacterium]